MEYNQFPEKWCIRATKETRPELEDYFSKLLGRRVICCNDSMFHYPEFRYETCTSTIVNKGYTELEYDEFLRLKEGNKELNYDIY